jgi:hypothetical protein
MVVRAVPGSVPILPRMFANRIVMLAVMAAIGCNTVEPNDGGQPMRDAAALDAGSARDAQVRDASRDAGERDGGVDSAVDAGIDAGPRGPVIDRGDPRLVALDFTADRADPEARQKLGAQLAYVDTRVEPRGRLVVYLHGAGAPSTCGSREHARVLAELGFHVFSPCYVSDYGVANCGRDVEACRLEAFDGVDRHPFVRIAPPDAIERRVVRGLAHLASVHPGGDWGYFLDDEGAVRWDRVVISGISHGASTAGLIGVHREVARVVMLSGPLDRGQAWLDRAPRTARERFFGFTHTADAQHEGHLEGFQRLGLPGAPFVVDGAASYGGSHRLVSSAASPDGHLAVEAGWASPRIGEGYAYLPVWRALYLGEAAPRP